MQRTKIRQVIKEEYEKEKTDTNYNFLTRFAKAVYDASVKADSSDWIIELREFIQTRLNTSKMILEDVPLHMSKRQDLVDDVEFCEALLDKIPLSVDRWISVDDQLPNHEYAVLAVVNDEVCPMAYVTFKKDGNEFRVWCSVNDWNGDPEYDDNYNVTHWMEIPNSSKP